MKPIRLLILVSLTLLVFAFPVWAGGWAVVTLDHLPEQVVVGQPLDLGFMVRQHGTHPVGDLVPDVWFYNPTLAKSITVTAKAQGEPGHYAATVTLPSAGAWEWSISGFGIQPMPDLIVVDNQSVTLSAVTSKPLSSGALIFGGVCALIAAGGAVALVRTRAAWAGLVTLLALLIGGVGLVSASTSTSTPTALRPIQESAELRLERGRRLFIAKGCVVCHTHIEMNAVRRKMGWDASGSIGPNLTDFTADPDYLAKWLNNPAEVKPETAMPRLGLDKDEIEALIVFINVP